MYDTERKHAGMHMQKTRQDKKTRSGRKALGCLASQRHNMVNWVSQRQKHQAIPQAPMPL